MTEPELVTRECPEGCGHEVTAPASGRGSATWLMSQHLWNKHKIKSTAPRRGKGKAAPEVVVMGRDPISLAKETVAAVGGGKTAPSADQLNRGLAHGLTLATMGAATYLAESDPGLQGPDYDDARDSLIDSLTLPEADAAKLTRPIARIVAPTGLNRRFGRAVVDNVDVVDTVYVAMDIVFRYRNYLRDRTQRTRSASIHQLPVPTAAPIPLPPVDTTAPVAEQGATAPGQGRNGRVIGYEEAQAMRAQLGAPRG